MVVLVDVLMLSNEQLLVLRLRSNGGETLREEVLRRLRGDLHADLLDFLQARVDTTLSELLGGHLVSQSSRGHQERLLRYGVHRARHHRQRDTRENVRIITLTRNERLVLVLEDVERRSGGEDALSVGVHVGLVWGEVNGFSKFANLIIEWNRRNDKGNREKVKENREKSKGNRRKVKEESRKIRTCSAVHSAFEVGLESGKISGDSLYCAILRSTFGVNTAGCAQTPIRQDGFTMSTTFSRSW